MNNTTSQIAVTLDDSNRGSVMSSMASELFQAGLNPRVALLAASSWVGAAEYLEEDTETFFMAFTAGLEVASVDIKGVEEQPNDEVDGQEIIAALIKAHYLEETDSPCLTHMITIMGGRFEELLSHRTEAYKPALASEGITRRFGYAPTKYSNLFKEATHALEATEYTVDSHMLEIARQVIAKTGGMDNDKEGYVIRGCELMDADEAYVSEFKGDRRGRMYQASCHGPNGQASDRSRALMNLAGVTMDYDMDVVVPVLKHEMADMVSVKCPKERAQLVRFATQNPVDFIIMHTNIKEDENQQTIVSKPYSFVKAANLLVKLHAGERPYLGMAVGLDAKCSGPQLGALMVGDGVIAQACGFSMQQVQDAYMRAIVECNKVGFHGLEREDIKKPFMGIFYGQGFAAFLDPDSMSPACWNSVYGEGEILGDEDRAKMFHKAISKSFGSKMMAVRQAIKSYSDRIDKKIKHYMPDGFEVAMNYKQQVNVLGEAIDFDTERYDVFVTNNEYSFKFINYTLNTKETHCGDFARNGFVNMIQATDALLARLIIVHLNRLGAQHIICVHDCFRVNMTEMHLLEKAIKLAYMDLFGETTNKRTEDMPFGLDILGLYFEGANKALMPEEAEASVSQFFPNGTRRLMKIGGERVGNLIKALGQTYYFAK